MTWASCPQATAKRIQTQPAHKRLSLNLDAQVCTVFKTPTV